MKIPNVCETTGCANEGRAVNIVSGIPDSEIDLFYESFDGPDEADYCPLCGALGVAEDPVNEDELSPPLPSAARLMGGAI